MVGLAAYLGAGPTAYSISMRSTILGLSALLIVSTTLGNKVRFIRGIFWLPLIVFWCAYLLRIYLDTSLHPASLARNVSDYWYWAVGACLVPMLALLTYPNRNYLANSYKAAFVMATIAAFLTASLGTGLIQTEYGPGYDTGRLQLQSLNAISVGHLGLSLLILSIWPLINGWNGSWGYRRIISIGAGLLGLYLLVAAASRGPLVTLILVLFFYFMAQDFKRYWRVLTVVALLFVLMIQAGSYLEEVGTYRAFSRAEGAFSGQDEAVSERQIAYKGAVNQFIQSPIIGDSLEEKETRLYPHNVVLESFMATGLIGGLPFVILILYGIYISFRNLKMKSEHGWIALLFIQYLIAAQFSGALYASSILWTFLALNIVLYSKWRPTQTRLGVRHCPVVCNEH